MITVKDIERKITDSGAELRGSVYSDDHRFEGFQLWFRYPVQYYTKLSTTANPFVAALLLPAMFLNQTLRFEQTVSQKMLEGVEKFMEIANKWRPEYKLIKIVACSSDQNAEKGQNIGMFFSGGLDSFYTLLKNENSKSPASEKISHLIFLHGFDIKLDDYELFDAALKGVKAVAKHYHKEIVQVTTNVRQITNNILDWQMYHGTALISVALGMEGALRKIYIAADHTHKDLFPRGSHPLTDPLWATETMDIVHDGCEATRTEKILWQVGKSQVALDNLRVCWESRSGKYNCGICEKCIRTVLNLEAASLLERCKTFKRKLRYSNVKKMRIDNEHTRAFAKHNYEAFIARGANPRLIKAIKRSLNPRAQNRFGKLMKNIRT